MCLLITVFLQIKLGTRVMRGPNWSYKCEDNGEGFLGTIVAFNQSERRVEVIWDTGRRGQYRADPEQYDLRIFDNAQTGTIQLYHTFITSCIIIFPILSCQDDTSTRRSV